MTSAIECSMGVSVVKGEVVLFFLELSMLSPAFICLEVLHTLEYDNQMQCKEFRTQW